MSDKQKTERGTEEWAKSITRPWVGRYSNAPHNPERCCASVRSRDGWRSYQCSRKPKVHYGSLGYCKQHDPASVVKATEERHARWEEERDERLRKAKKAEQAEALKAAALQAIRQIAEGHNAPRGLAMDVLEKWETGK